MIVSESFPLHKIWMEVGWMWLFTTSHFLRDRTAQSVLYKWLHCNGMLKLMTRQSSCAIKRIKLFNNGSNPGFHSRSCSSAWQPLVEHFALPREKSVHWLAIPSSGPHYMDIKQTKWVSGVSFREFYSLASGFWPLCVTQDFYLLQRLRRKLWSDQPIRLKLQMDERWTSTYCIQQLEKDILKIEMGRLWRCE